jgi:hypothetical protein
VPRINLGGRRCLVGLHCRAVDDNQRNSSHHVNLQSIPFDYLTI